MVRIVNGTRSGATTRFGGAPIARQFSVTRERRTGRIIDIRTFRGTSRAGFLGRGFTTRGATEAERIADARQRDIRRARDLIQKSKQGLAALTKSEKVELQGLIKKVGTTRLAPTVRRITGLSRADQARELERGRLESQARTRETEKLSLDLRRESLQAKQKTLERLSQRGLLQSGIATTFNNEIKALNADVKSFNTKVSSTQSQIARFQRKDTGRTIQGIAPSAAQKISVLREFEARVRQKDEIEPFQSFLGPASFARVRATRKAGAEFGAAIVPRGLEIFGARGGAAVASTLGIVEEAARTAVDVPLFGIEAFTGKPIRIPIRERPKGARALKTQIELFRGRRPTFFDPSLAERFRSQAKIPIAGDLLGFGQTITPEQRVVITRAALRDFGTSVALFLGPEVVVGAARARLPVRALKIKTRIPTPDELRIAEITRRRLKSIGQIRQSFAAVQKRASQQEITRLLGKPRPSVITRPAKPSRKAVKFGEFDIPKIRFPVPRKPVEAAVRKVRPKRIIVLGPAKPKQVKVVFLDERGGIGFGRQIQIPRPFGPIRIRVGRTVARRVRVTRFQDIFKQFDIQLRPPRTGTRLRLAALGTALTQKQLEASITFPLQALRDTTGFAELQRARQSELTAQAVRTTTTTITKDITAQRARQAERLKEFQRQARRVLTAPRISFVRPITPKRRIPKRPRPFFFPLPGLEQQKQRIVFEGRLGGFNTFIRRRGKNVKVNKVPLTERSAQGLGFLLADESARRSGFIRRAKGKAKRVPELTNIAQGLRFKFRRPKGKTRLARDSFVERTRFAIDTPQELAGITLKGRIASERNRAIRKVLKLPKKRKKKRKVKRKRKFKKQTRFFAF